MTDATVTEYVNCPIPNIEVVRLTLADENTYTSRKFSTILGASATGNTNLDGDINVTFSGAVATINWAGATAHAVTLILFGKH